MIQGHKKSRRQFCRLDFFSSGSGNTYCHRMRCPSSWRCGSDTDCTSKTPYIAETGIRHWRCDMGGPPQLAFFSLSDCFSKGEFCAEVSVSMRDILRYHMISILLHTLVLRANPIARGDWCFVSSRGCIEARKSLIDRHFCSSSKVEVCVMEFTAIPERHWDPSS